MPFVCGATNLGEALRRITEGAAMIRSKGEAGTGDVSNATTHMRKIGGEMRRLGSMSHDELYVAAKELQAPYDLVVEVAAAGKLPGGAVHRRRDRHPGGRRDDDAARRGGRVRRLRHLQVGQPGAARRRDRARPRLHYDDPDVIAKVSRGLGEAMVGINVADLPVHHRLADRGW